MVERPSVCLSVCLSHQSTASAACGGFAAGCPPRAGDIARQHRRPALSSNGAHRARHCAQQQMRAVSCSQPRDEAEHRLRRRVKIIIWGGADDNQYGRRQRKRRTVCSTVYCVLHPHFWSLYHSGRKLNEMLMNVQHLNTEKGCTPNSHHTRIRGFQRTYTVH